MDISEVGEILKLQLSKKQFPQDLIFSLVGHTGVGKTSIVKELAEELSYNYVPLYLAVNEDTGDLIGKIQVIDGKTCWAKPEWFPDKEVPTILFLDEWNRARGEIRQAIFPLLTERRLHTHILPKSVVLICAENPAFGDKEYQVEPLDPAMQARVVRIKVTNSSRSFCEYAKKVDLNKKVIGFANTHPEMFEKPISEESIYPDSDFVDARALEYASKIISLVGEDSKYTFELLAGVLGLSAAQQFTTYLKQDYAKYVEAAEFFSGKASANDIVSQTEDRIKMSLDSIVAMIKLKSKSNIESKITELWGKLGKEHKAYFAKRCSVENAIRKLPESILDEVVKQIV